MQLNGEESSQMKIEFSFFLIIIHDEREMDLHRPRIFVMT
jgi:hypothetical protein